MKLDVTTLRRISPLLDEALDLEASEREAWLAALSGESAQLAPILRELLAKQASVETNDLLERGPQFTAPGTDARASEFKEGDAVGPYRLIRELGHGGMGEVWLAERSDGVLKRSVALKLPMLSLRRSVLVQRFERERDILGALAHPNIARLYDAGLAADGQPFLALEYVEGLPITAYCEQQKLDSRTRIRLLLQVMDAVQYAHANLVIHRDLKPSNVLVTGEAKAMLLDFGIAKLLQEEQGEAHETELTQLGGRALTLDYAAPEQVMGAPISTATDVYALGVLLYELLTGERPFSGARREVEQAILTQAPARPNALPADLGVIVLKALKKAPAERYGTVEAFAQDLGRWQRGEAVLAQPDSRWYRVSKFVARHRVASVAAGVAVLVLVGFTVSLNMQLHKVTRERNRADRIAQFMTQVFKVSDPSEGRAGSITARDLLDRASKEIESGLADDPEQRAQLVRTMGRAYTGLGAFDRSEPLLRREYERAGATLGADDPQTLLLGAELVWLLYSRYQPVLAEPLARDILARQQRILGTDHPQTIMTESHLAAILAYLGRYDEAVVLRRHSIEATRKQVKPDDIGLLDEEASLGLYLMRSGNADNLETERIFREVIEGYRTKLGVASPKTLSAINRLAAVLAQEKKYDEEELLLRNAIGESQRTLGAEHFRVRDMVNNLAAALINKGDLEKAEVMLREALAVDVRVSDTDSPRAAISKYNLACVLSRRGDKEGALTLLADAIDHGLIPDAALEMEKENDLKSLRDEPRFKALVALVKKRYTK